MHLNMRSKALGLTSPSDKPEPLRSVWAENGTFRCVAEGLNGICKRRLPQPTL